MFHLFETYFVSLDNHKSKKLYLHFKKSTYIYFKYVILQYHWHTFKIYVHTDH
jgi:hypothetical protein